MSTDSVICSECCIIVLCNIILASLIGTQITFRLYGLLCLVVLGFFIHLNYYRKNEGYKFYEEENENVVVDDASALAPHGVPTNPVARSLSRQNLQHNNASEQTTVMQENNTNNTNPFVANDSYLDPNYAWNQR